MTAGDAQVGASQNLIQTYIRLALATPNATLSHPEGFKLCLGELDHPICNFAADLNLNPWSARRLASIAESRTSFNVYVSPGDGPDYLQELLRNAGFAPAYRLVQLTAEPTMADAPLSLEPCTGQEKLAVATFMVDQFFAQRPLEFRIAIAKATSEANGVELYRVGEKSRHIAAVMLSEGGGMLGCYNLCVAPSSRGRGTGSSLTRWVLAQAAARGQMVTIQCEPHLESWYRSLGFERWGWLNVYQLSKGPTSDIIETI